MRILCDFSFQTSGQIPEHQSSETGFEGQTLSKVHSKEDKNRKNKTEVCEDMHYEVIRNI